MNASRTIFASVLFAITSSIANGERPAGERVSYLCNTSLVVAFPTEVATPTNILKKLQTTRIPGAGGVLCEWEIRRVRTNLFEISGLVIDDNAAVPQSGIPMFIGNLELTNILARVAITGTNGLFRFTASVETLSEIRNALPQGAFMLEPDAPDHAKKETTSEVLIHERRYLYIGRDGVDLYRYRIPYEDANSGGVVTQSGECARRWRPVLTHPSAPTPGK